MAVGRQHVYVTLGFDGIAIVDHTMSPPAIVGTLPTPGGSFDLVARSGYLYVAANGNGMVTVDATDPTNPFVTDALLVEGFARTIEQRDNFLFVGSSRSQPSGWFTVFQVFNPPFPFEAGRIFTPWWPGNISLVGDRAYITDSICFEFSCLGGLGVYDISDPFFPQEIGYGGTGPMDGLAMSGDLAYLAREDRGLWVIDASVPDIQQYVFTDTEIGGTAAGLIDETLFLSAEGLLVLDIEEPLAPTIVDELVTNPDGFASHLEIFGNRIYVTDGPFVHVFDAANPRPLAPQSMIAGDVSGVTAVGSIAYLATDEGVVAVDISDPKLPVPSPAVDSPGTTVDLVEQDGLLYVADNEMGLAIFDLADPLSPVLIGSKRGGGFANSVVVRHPYAYVTEHGTPDMQALRVFDVSDPTAPFRVESVPLQDDALGIDVVGNTAFIANEFDGVVVLDVTDPTNVVEVGALVTAERAYDVIADGNVLYVADGEAGLTVYDYPDFGSAVWLNRTSLPGVATRLWQEGDLLFVAVDDAGVLVFDVSVPSLPEAIGSLPRGSNSTDVFARDGLVLIADNEGGAILYPGACNSTIDVEPEAVVAVASRLAQNRPNPFNPTTRIPFELDASEAVTLRVFDAHGRLVRTLVDGERLTSGTHDRVWDGLDERGRRVAAGTYFYRIDTPTVREQRSAVLVR